MKLTFGKHKGFELADCPKDYLQWLLNPQTKSGVFKVDPTIQEEARKILEENSAQEKSFKTGISPLTYGDVHAPEFGKENILKTLDEIIGYLQDKRSDIAKR